MRYFIFASILFLGGTVVLPLQTQALTISPVKLEVSGDPGQTLEGELSLFNEQDEAKTFYSSSENFEARGETGAPFFLHERVALATWIKTEEHVTLQPKEEKAIPFSIQIPQNAEPGGYFAAILWGTTPLEATEGGQVGVGGRLGMLILLKVSGTVEEGGGLLEFGAHEQRKFFSSLPISFSYRFNNTGGDRVVPQGDITITNLFGMTSATLPVNQKGGSVLPNSSRKFDVIWQNKEQATDDTEQDEGLSAGVLFATAGQQFSDFHFGWYTAKMNLSWGTQNQTADAAYRFFIIPWQLLLIVILVVVIIGFAGTMGLKKWDRWIISKAVQQQQK